MSSLDRCIGWIQTGGCKPDGTKEPWNNKPCNAVIPDGHSGFCECRRGGRRGGKVKTMEKDCTRGKYKTCEEACIAWTQRKF